MDGKSLLEYISGFKDNMQKYLETKVSYYGIVAFEKAVIILSGFFSNVIILVTLLISIIFIAGAIAIYIGSLLESYGLGLLIVGGFFLLLALIMIIFRKKLFTACVIRSLSDIFFKDDQSPKD